MFTAKEKLRITEVAENIGNSVTGRKYDVSESCIRDWRRKTKQDLDTFHGQKARHPELQKRLRDYMDDKRQCGCAATSEMCQLKALAVTKELGITGFKVTLRLCQVVGADLSSSGDWHGVATANHV